MRNDDYRTIVSGFDEKLSATLSKAAINVPLDHLIRPALCPLFRDTWVAVITTVDALASALSGTAPPQISADTSTLTVVPVTVGPLDTVIVAEPRCAKTISSSPRLTELVQAYLQQCEAEDNYASDLRMYARRLQENLGGDRHVAEITRRDLLAFLSQISCLPARMANNERKLTLSDLVRESEKQRQTGSIRPCLSRKTTDKWFQCLAAMFRFGMSHELCKFNPTEGITRHRRRNIEPPRQAFEQSEIHMIFTSAMYQGNNGDAYRCLRGPLITRDAKFWLPLLALFTGCRHSEMVQARIADVKEIDGIQFLHITTEINDCGRKKKVKTANSRRMVPLHRNILDAGFLTYVASHRRSGELYLFPEIDQSVKEPAGSLGKWFDRFCERLAKHNQVPVQTGVDALTRTFHSFRHTFKRACRDAEIEKDVHDELTGHAGAGDVGSAYGRTTDGRFSLKLLNSAIQKVSFSGYVPPKE